MKKIIYVAGEDSGVINKANGGTKAVTAASVSNRVCRARRLKDGMWIEGLLLKLDGSLLIVQDMKRQDANNVYCHGEQVDKTSICRCSDFSIDGHVLAENDVVVNKRNNSRGTIRYGRFDDSYGFYIDWGADHRFWKNDIPYWLEHAELEVQKAK